MKQIGVLLLGVAMLCYLPGNVTGEPITDPSQLSPNPTLIDFEQFTTAGPVNNPLVIGDVTFSSEDGLDIRDITGYPADGTEVESMLLETSSHYTPLMITFSNPVSEVILGWWDPNYPGNFLRAYGEDDSLLEEVELTDLGPEWGVHATWIGFKRPFADISRIEINPGTPSDHFGVDNIYYNIPTVSIDVKPGDNTSTINPRGKSISVAILSLDGFNAPQMVDPATLTFGPTGNEVSSTGCTRKPKDVNGDGKPDLVCQFPMKLEGGNLPLFECEDTMGILKGEMVIPEGRSSFKGQQAVVIAPCK